MSNPPLICCYNGQSGQMTCVSTIPERGPGFSGQFSSGNNNIPGCHDNPNWGHRRFCSKTYAKGRHDPVVGFRVER
jgi:hypothetical protein